MSAHTPAASSACPHCGRDTPHYHSPDELAAMAEIEAWADVSLAQFRLSEAAPDMLAALEGLQDILNRAESNASGNPEWEAVSKRVNAARAAIEKATGK